MKNNGNEVYALMERSDIIRHSFFLMKRTNKSYSVQGGEENSLFNLKGEAKMNGNIQAICAVVMVIIEAIRLYREIKKGSDLSSEPFSFKFLINPQISNFLRSQYSHSKFFYPQ